MASGENCPITDIQFSTTGGTFNASFTKDANTYGTDSNKKFVWISRETPGDPIV